MPRPRNVIPSKGLNLKLPEDLRTRLDLALYSPLEGRVPKGAYQRLFTDLAEEWLARQREGEVRIDAPITGE